jgi:hypothetical protein
VSVRCRTLSRAKSLLYILRSFFVQPETSDFSYTHGFAPTTGNVRMLGVRPDLRLYTQKYVVSLANFVVLGLLLLFCIQKVQAQISVYRTGF